MIFGTISLGLCFYCYRPIVVFVPLLLLGFLICYKKYFTSINKKSLLCSLLLILLILSPLIYTISYKKGTARFDMISIFKDYRYDYAEKEAYQKWSNNFF
jgi:4-amino-4-deoxy-L-arabinose transferase-like glycosyltransferase